MNKIALEETNQGLLHKTPQIKRDYRRTKDHGSKFECWWVKIYDNRRSYKCI